MPNRHLPGQLVRRKGLGPQEGDREDVEEQQTDFQKSAFHNILSCSTLRHSANFARCLPIPFLVLN